jgi:hypothetical protein
MSEAELNLELPGLYLVCGLQGGGKSHLLRYIVCKNKKKFDVALVFSNTGFVDGNFDYVDRRFVHHEYSEDILRNFKDIFQKQIEAGKHPSGLIVFDDCISGKQWRSPELVSLVTQVRHYGVTVLLSTQYPKAIPPLFHTNSFKTFMFFLGSKSAIQALYEYYGQLIGSFEEWKAFYTNATTPKYHCLVYDARNGSQERASRYQVVMAPKDIPRFCVGPNLDKK